MNNIEFKYLNITEDDADFGLWVSTVGFQSIDPGMTYPIKSHPTGYYFNPEKGRTLNEFQFIFISKGEGVFSAQHYDNMKVTKGNLLMIFPGQWHSYHPAVEKGWDEFYIGFGGPTIAELIAKTPLVQENQILDIGLNEELESLFIRAIEEAQKYKMATQQYLVGIAMHIIGLVLSANFNKGTVDELEEKIQSAISIMSRNVSNAIDILQIASNLNMSYSYFRKEFKKRTGTSPNQYFQDLKMKSAKQLLFSTNLSVKEICFQLGYSSKPVQEDRRQDACRVPGVHPVQGRAGTVKKEGVRSMPSPSFVLWCFFCFIWFLLFRPRRYPCLSRSCTEDTSFW